jgi:hypothetical protein
VGADGRVRAYVKNVYASVDADALKAALSKYGELPYFDVSRAKVRSIPGDSNARDWKSAFIRDSKCQGNPTSSLHKAVGMLGILKLQLPGLVLVVPYDSPQPLPSMKDQTDNRIEQRLR